MGRRGDDAPAAPDGWCKNDAGGMSRVSCGLWPLATLAGLCCGTGFGTPKGSVSPVARREAPARWAVAAKGGKATRSAPKGSVSPAGCCAKRKATRRCEQIQGLRVASAQNADICEGSETSGGGGWGKRCGWNEPRFLRPLAARNACEVVLRHRFWGAAPNPGRGLRPLHPALDPPAPPSPQFFNAYILKVIRHDLLRRAARLRHAIGAPLAHAHAMAIARAGHHELALLRAQAGDEG